jgi:hypothetical protein
MFLLSNPRFSLFNSSLHFCSVAKKVFWHQPYLIHSFIYFGNKQAYDAKITFALYIGLKCNKKQFIYWIIFLATKFRSKLNYVILFLAASDEILKSSGSASVREVLAIITPVTGIGHLKKQNLYLFILKRCQISWLVWGEDEGQSLLYSWSTPWSLLSCRSNQLWRVVRKYKFLKTLKNNIISKIVSKTTACDLFEGKSHGRGWHLGPPSLIFLDVLKWEKKNFFKM